MMKNKRPTLENYEQEAFKNEDFKAEYEALRPEFELIKKFIQARQKAQISQIDLAQRLKVQQPSIARLEKGGYASTSINRLSRVANALGYDLKISLQAKKRS